VQLKSGSKREREETDLENGAGWMLFSADFLESKKITKGEFVWSDDDRKAAIHILEARAMLMLLEWIPAQPVLTRLIIGEDNTIVVSAVTKGYSSAADVCVWTKKILDEAKRKNLVLEIIWVPSKENSADPISRGLPPCDQRNLDTWKILHGEPPRTEKRGRRSKEEDPKANPQVEGLEGSLCRLKT